MLGCFDSDDGIAACAFTQNIAHKEATHNSYSADWSYACIHYVGGDNVVASHADANNVFISDNYPEYMFMRDQLSISSDISKCSAQSFYGPSRSIASSTSILPSTASSINMAAYNTSTCTAPTSTSCTAPTSTSRFALPELVSNEDNAMYFNYELLDGGCRRISAQCLQRNH